MKTMCVYFSRWVIGFLFALWTQIALGQGGSNIQSLRIESVSEFYDKPYLLDFNFSLRDQDNHAVITNPTNIVVVCKEDGLPISLSETGFRLLTGANKQLKCFLVLDYTLSMADPALNGDTDNDGLSDAIETMETAAKTLIGTLNKDAQIGIYEFHREDTAHPPTKVIDLTDNKSALSNHIDSIWPDFVQYFPAATRCWDAVYAAVNEYPVNTSVDEQRFVIFLSDGKDESSTHTPADLIGLAQSRKIKIYAIGFGHELASAALINIASLTSGQYYAADNITELADRFQEITRDIQGQYVLRWATLRRASSSFKPSFELTYQGQTASFMGTNYNPTLQAGDILQGRLTFDSSLGEDGRASIGLRAIYVPRFITRLRFNQFANKPFTVTKVPVAEGGLCPDNWILDQNDSDGWIELRSPNPQNIFTALPYASFGKLLRFEFLDVTNLSRCFIEYSIDNSAYPTGGQSFILNNAREVVSGSELPLYGTPIYWLQEYGFTQSFARAELQDPDEDGLAMWQEYISGTNPTNRLSVLDLRLIKQARNSYELNISTVSNRTYRVDYSDNMRQWLTLQSNIQGNDEVLSFLDSARVEQRFYRVVITDVNFHRSLSMLGAVSWWPFEGIVNGSLDITNGAKDTLDGNNAHLALFPTNFDVGKVGSGLVFPGVEKFVLVPAANNLSTPSFTWEGWIKPGDASLASPIFGFSGKVVRGVNLWMTNNGGLLANIVDTTGAEHVLATGPNVFVAGTWYHVALTFDQASGAAKAYVAGTSVYSTNFHGITPQTTNSLFFGYYPAMPGGDRYKGMMDEVVWYNRALAPQEIAEIAAGQEHVIDSQFRNQPQIKDQPQAKTVTPGSDVV